MGCLLWLLITYNQFEGTLKSEHQKIFRTLAISTCEQVDQAVSNNLSMHLYQEI